MDTKEQRRRSKSSPRTAVPTKPRKRRPVPNPNARRSSGSNVVYTEPKPFSRKRFLLRMVTVLAVVLAVVFGMSIFFKVEYVNVSGTEKYTPWEIKEAAGLQIGNNLLTLSDANISGKIMKKLPYVEKVRVGIKLPNTVNIEITESAVTYAVEADDGTWWLMNAEGKVVDETSPEASGAHTQVLGIQIAVPAIGQLAVAGEPQQEDEAQSDASESVPESISEETMASAAAEGSEQLSAAIAVMQALEENKIAGQAASINVSNLGALELWYGRRYQVALGDTDQLSYKIGMMKAAINQMGEHQGGQLDVSFINWPDKVGYTPFGSG